MVLIKWKHLKQKKISGFRVTATQRAKLKRALTKLTKGLDKRPI